MEQELEPKKRRRVIGHGALRRDPTLLALAGRGPADGTFLDRRRPGSLPVEADRRRKR